MRISGHAYPWDVIGDPGFVDRIAELGITSVTLAAAYHSVRAATPLHPRHQIVDARYAALYRPVRESAWRGKRLKPAGPDWLDTADGFGDAAVTLHKAGIAVSAWIVLTHNTRLGTRYPELAVTNCFGERYPYALCPGNAEVRDHAATLAAESVREAPIAAVSLEACGQLGVAHLGHHDKTAGAWSGTAAELLSVCCCAACQFGWRAGDLDPAVVTAALCAAVTAEAAERPTPLDPELMQQLLAVRHANTDALRTEVLARLAEVAPQAEVTLHGQTDPWATGPSPGLTAGAAKQVSAILVPAWPSGQATERLVAEAAQHGKPVDAYVTALTPIEADAVIPHANRLVDAGANRLSLYHLGLASGRRQRLFGELTREFS